MEEVKSPIRDHQYCSNTLVRPHLVYCALVWWCLSLMPRPFFREEEKGPGTHHLHMHQHFYLFSHKSFRKFNPSRGLLYGRHETAIVTRMLGVNRVVAEKCLWLNSHAGFALKSKNENILPSCLLALHSRLVFQFSCSPHLMLQSKQMMDYPHVHVEIALPLLGPCIQSCSNLELWLRQATRMLKLVQSL